MIRIDRHIGIPDDEIHIAAVRARGPGGQHVNKVASAAHLRFDIQASSLPTPVKQRLLARRDRRISHDGVIVIKAQRHRSLEQNRAEAIERLVELVRSATRTPKRRIATRPPARAAARRIELKKRRGRTKALRRRVTVSDL